MAVARSQEQGRKVTVPWVDTNEATPSSTKNRSCRNNWLFRSQTQLIHRGCRQWSWHFPVQWLSLANHHLSFMQMETQRVSCHQAPSFSLTMGTASSVSCMLEAVNRELSSLIHLHIEDMEKNPLFLLTLLPTQLSVKQGGEYGPSLYVSPGALG